MTIRPDLEMHVDPHDLSGKPYISALELMLQSFDALSKKTASPTLCYHEEYFFYRYNEKSIHQAILQKLARILTCLQSVGLLNQAGFLQEQAALQRMLDEFCEDIMFLCFGVIFNDMTELHKKYLDYFYEEEFDVFDNAIESTQKRQTVPRKKIRAFISKNRGNKSDQSTMIELLRTVNKTYSGYVHGASPQIMELYYGHPPKFHLRGCVDSPLFELHKQDVFNYYYRSLSSFAFASNAFGENKLSEKLHNFMIEFAVALGRKADLGELA